MNSSNRIITSIYDNDSYLKSYLVKTRKEKKTQEKKDCRKKEQNSKQEQIKIVQESFMEKKTTNVVTEKENENFIFHARKKGGTRVEEWISQENKSDEMRLFKQKLENSLRNALERMGEQNTDQTPEQCGKDRRQGIRLQKNQITADKNLTQAGEKLENYLKYFIFLTVF